MTYQTDSTKPEDTLNLAAEIGSRLKGGEVIELISDLGGGKTAFVRGLARGMGSLDQVASPTFTISREYHTEKLELHHFDFYRLSEAGVIRAELEESIAKPKVAVVIEWAGVVSDVLPQDRLSVKFEKTGDNSRKIDFLAGTSHKHLLKNLAKA